MTLSRWRSEIDALDKQLVKILNQRAALALEIGNEKQKQGLPMRSPEREKQVLENVRKLNEGPLSDGALHRLFQLLMDECCRLEEEDLV
jgi:chorismate mutase